MKIALIIDTLIAAGTQLHLIKLALGLKNKGFAVTVFCLEERGVLAEQLEKNGIEVMAFNTKSIYHPTTCIYLFKLVKKLRELKPDLVQTFLLKANLLGVLAAKLAGVSAIISSRRSMGYDLKKRHYFLLKLLESFTSATMVNSKAIQRHSIEKENIKKKKVKLIYNGVELQKYQRSFDKDCGKSLRQKVIGIVANIRPIKGYEYLIEAFIRICQSYPDSYCVIVGNSRNNEDYLKKLLEQADSAGVKNKLIIIENCTDIPAFLSLFDIAILSSNSEGFSNTLIEYMAAGKSIIATDVGGNGEAIINQETGLLIPSKNSRALAEAIYTLFDNPEMAERLAKAAREKAKSDFSLEKMIQEHISFYRNLVLKTEIY